MALLLGYGGGLAMTRIDRLVLLDGLESFKTSLHRFWITERKVHPPDTAMKDKVPATPKIPKIDHAASRSMAWKV